MPYFKLHFPVVIEELSDTFYLEHQTEVVPVFVLLPLLAVAEACYFDVVEVADSLALLPNLLRFWQNAAIPSDMSPISLSV